MKKILLFCFALLVQSAFAQTNETFHDFNAVTIRGDSISLSDFAGKKLLVVNTASYCGFTPQYADLEALYQQYGGPTFEIIGFPCNDFGGQEPGTNGSIDTFCTGNYNISFQMMSRISIAAPDTAEVYKWLQNASRNGIADAPVAWNFNKYLIDEAGHWIAYYPSAVNPLDPLIVNWVLSPNTTNVDKAENNQSLKLVSNPVKGRAEIEFLSGSETNISIELFSIDGVSVFSLPVQKIQKQQHLIIPVDQLPDGIYFLKVKNSERVQQILRLVVVNN
ncbi:MAG: T9SS type A sorting domain-containing protein [Bacteroidetes bacterium]|nr:T9SS type A sorting domain-containing protein [Bacteroidota bacterium]MBL0065174.1 T9SS type A sorting domain-containing protein [Bacteroidota bacterium]MBL0138431.1 T9SS type A sorting domain-containing protein [Bacteroidota bacterium]